MAENQATFKMVLCGDGGTVSISLAAGRGEGKSEKVVKWLSERKFS
jgi:hypothetical protein